MGSGCPAESPETSGPGHGVVKQTNEMLLTFLSHHPAPPTQQTHLVSSHPSTATANSERVPRSKPPCMQDNLANTDKAAEAQRGSGIV